MARKSNADFDRMTPFARWLAMSMKEREISSAELAKAVGISLSQLHKILKSYESRYAAYQRPGYEKTVAIGEYLSDLRGALEAAGYTVVERSRTAEEILSASPGLTLEEAKRRADDELKYSGPRDPLERFPALGEMYGELVAARADGILTKELAAQIKRDVIRALNAERYERSKVREPEPEEGQN